MINVNKLIIDTLKEFNIPIRYRLYSGSETTYITFFEMNNFNERLRISNETFEKEKAEFEKYKELEKEKLELESKKLSESCARFKDLVTQFNSGFNKLPGE